MPEPVFQLNALQYAAIVVLTSFAAGLVPLYTPRPERCAHLLVGFAAGAVLGLALWHMLPDAVHAFEGTAIPAAVVFILAGAGFGALYFIEHVLLPHEHHHLHQAESPDGHSLPHLAGTTHEEPGHIHGPDCELVSSDLCEVCDIGFYSVASFIGLSLHSFVDGLYLSLDGVVAAPWIIFLGIALHKLAEAFVLTTIFHLAGYPRRRTIAILVAFLAMTPLGAYMGTAVMANTEIQTAYLSAIAAGGFLYIAFHGLIPALWRQKQVRWSAALSVAGGIAVIYLASVLAIAEGGHAGHGH